VEARPREILIYELEDGSKPFSDWMDGLVGDDIYGIILNRLDRVEDGNLGDCGPVGSGVSEFVIDVGPGYRVYFGQDGDLVVLLCGGTKKSQSRDIETAKKHWKNYNA
jgi:putative addiction module killer protein